MKTICKVLAVFMILLFCSAKSVIEVFTIDGFEKSLSKISDKFYMSKFEVTNLQYRTFLAELKAKGEMDKYRAAQIDSINWRDKYAYNEPYVELYHSHPAYNHYPVVNISYEGAVMYCEWLTEKYNSYEKRKFKKVVFRLPTTEEWKLSAHGGLTNNVYPWKERSLMNSDCKYMCNFQKFGDEGISYDAESKKYIATHQDTYGIAGSLNDNADITAPVNSYYPNGFGICNVSGNVSEMVSEKGKALGGSYKSPGYDVRIESSEKFEKNSNHIGFRVCMDVVETWK